MHAIAHHTDALVHAGPPAAQVAGEIRLRRYRPAQHRGVAVDPLVSDGGIVSGALLRRSILFYGARAGEGSVVEDSVVLPNVSIGRGVTLRRTIVDRLFVLPDGFQAGLDPEKDRARFNATGRGIVLITREILARA